MKAATIPGHRPARPGGLLATVPRRLLVEAARRGTGGVIEMTEGDWTQRLGTGDLVARVTIGNPRAFASVLGSGSVGLGESYVAGWWDSDDLTTLVRVLIRASAPLRSRLDGLGRTCGRALDLPARLVAPNGDDDRRNISEHYDLSNEFFSLMLDETMTYSCGVFEDPGLALADAQLAKIDRLCSKLELGPADHLLEIGSGWGAFALRAAGRYGARVTTTTISGEQRSYVEKQVADAGLSDRVTVLGDDWRTLGGRFDKLVSVEMIEAVDWRWHDRFLAACSDRLVDGGLAAIQAIVIDDRSFERAKHHQDFVRRMVFPGSCIPSVASITASLARATDLAVVGLEDIGRHYPETLRRWAGNLQRNTGAVTGLGVSDRFRRLWSLYLAYCEASFIERRISDVQLVLAKPHRAARPQRDQGVAWPVTA